MLLEGKVVEYIVELLLEGKVVELLGTAARILNPSEPTLTKSARQRSS